MSMPMFPYTLVEHVILNVPPPIAVRELESRGIRYLYNSGHTNDIM